MDFKNWSLTYIKNLKEFLDKFNLDDLEKAVDILWEAYQNDQFIYVVGNGGSASTASHMACDFSKTLKGHKGDAPWDGFKIISLTDNNSLITAWSNDTSYEVAYAQQLKNLAKKGDVLIAISSSGNSKNILNCIDMAHSLKMKVIGISGFHGGALSKVSDVALTTDSQEYGPVEDIQLILNHIIVFYFYDKLQKTPKLNSL